jgi:hypothetical protein
MSIALHTAKESGNFKMTSCISFNANDIKKDKNEYGYLIQYDVPIARTGEFVYRAHELAYLFDEKIDPYKSVRLYRDDKSFSADVLNASKDMVFTNDHPDGAVTSENATSFFAGVVHDLYAKDGILYAGRIVVYDQSTIDAIEKNGKKEVSIGFEGNYTLKPQTIDGQDFDGLEEIVRINHLSLVDKGKAGSYFKMHKQEDAQVSDKMYKTTVNGVEVELPIEKIIEMNKADLQSQISLNGKILSENMEKAISKISESMTSLNSRVDSLIKTINEAEKEKEDDEETTENEDGYDDKDKETSKNGVSKNGVSFVKDRVSSPFIHCNSASVLNNTDYKNLDESAYMAAVVNLAHSCWNKGVE